ncbi:Zinc finger CCCH domain-containing protein 7 [Gossypium australe]|uniref:Zinc finger CCCH domain-containing protein 7 n=1 Tax=Gossypium australe TaxID=47621 RepID=A0A5B6WN87_9ROSI|nr:Zinc finger CCCH domain-containing protein 7 [Gossypium australe]
MEESLRAKEKLWLGFANFNLSLLAKQGWCLITFSNSLLARTLKAKYYPDVDFLNARLGKYTFLYLEEHLGGQRNSLRRSKISTNEVVWVPGSMNCKIQNTKRCLDTFRVADLIDNNTRNWKGGFIRQTFSDLDANRILKIPLAKFQYNDLLVWKGEASREFTVCSVYKSLLQYPIRTNYTNHQSEHANVCKKLWGMNLPSKLKITFWRF